MFDPLSLVLILAAGLIGAALSSVVLNKRIRQSHNQCDALQSRLTEEIEKRSRAEERSVRVNLLEQELALVETRAHDLELELSRTTSSLNEERRRLQEKIETFKELETAFSDSFKALSANALEKNNELFFKLAQERFARVEERSKEDLDKRRESIDLMLKPLNESLTKVDHKLVELEKARAHAYGSLSEHLKMVAEGQSRLQHETSQLVGALRMPQVRGRWGEIHLRRVVELAGMVEYCDFTEQVSQNTEDGRLRPDLIVHLPNDKVIVVDAKVSLKAYLDSIEAADDTARDQQLQLHASSLRKHINQLGAKEYWSHFKQTPEFVVLFVPGESFFSEAMRYDQHLIEFGVERKVILATPTTLIALFKAVAYGWKQEQVSKNTQVVAKLGQELYDRIATLAEHFNDLKSGLERATKAYNNAVGTLERRVISTARRFKELEVVNSRNTTEITEIELMPRQLESQELIQGDTEQ